MAETKPTIEEQPTFQNHSSMAETKPAIEEQQTLQNHSTMAETKPTIEEQPTLQNHSIMAETKPTIEEQPMKAWHSYLSEDLPQSFMDSTDTAFASFRSFQDFIPEIKQKFQSYEHAVFTNLKDGLSIGAEHPAMAAGITLAATFALFRGPRRFLFRQTVGRFQSEEARFARAERNMKMLEISVDLMKKESRKLLERSTFAEKEMRSGQAELINVGKKMRRLAKSVNHVESQAADLMDLLREMPGREALRLRAEVASTASLLNHQRTGLVKRMSKLTEAGIPV